MTTPNLQLSVVMPAYNEEGAIAEAVTEVQQWVLATVPTAEFIIVDDGSRDRTGAILDELAKQETRLSIIHQANAGHGRALRTGLEAARGEYCFLLDSDRQIPLDVFPELWQAARGCNGVFGVRTQCHDPWLRLVITRLVRLALRLWFGVRLQDANVPCKIIRRTDWLRARTVISEDCLTPSLLLAVWMRQQRLVIVEQRVPHRPRLTGQTQLHRWRLLRFCGQALCQLLEFRRRCQ